MEGVLNFLERFNESGLYSLRTFFDLLVLLLIKEFLVDFFKLFLLSIDCFNLNFEFCFYKGNFFLL